MNEFLLVVLNSAWLAVTVLFFASRSVNYSHVRHTISELGEVTSPRSRIVSLGVFLPVGLCCLVVSWLVFGNGESGRGATAALAACVGVGYLGGAIFPCDEGSPLEGTWRQGLHNLAGGVEYIGGAAALWSLGTEVDLLVAAIWYQIAAVTVCLCALLMSSPGLFRWRGAIQRTAECLLFGSLIAATWQLAAK